MAPKYDLPITLPIDQMEECCFCGGDYDPCEEDHECNENKINSHNSRIKNVLRTYENWLYRGEVRLLTDFLEQIRKKGTLSQKQIVTVEKIAKDCEKRKTQPPRIVRG